MSRNPSRTSTSCSYRTTTPGHRYDLYHTNTSRRVVEGAIGRAPELRFSCGAEPALPPNEVEALMCVFAGSGGPSWARRDGWGEAHQGSWGYLLNKVRTDAGTWYGVERRGGHVIKLLLAANLLEGSLARDISGLPRLEVLYLNDNRLAQSLPSGMGALKHLRELHLSNNKLTGEIPEDLGLLEGLETLHLNGNELSGPIPASFGGLRRLTQMWLHKNYLEGAIPAELGELAALKQLYLFENYLSGELPPELGDLGACEEMWLNDNYLTGHIPESFGGLVRLKELNLRSNRLSGDIPHSVLQLPGKGLFLFQTNHRQTDMLTQWMDTTPIVQSLTI